jgi:hypothetical protein
MRPVFLPLVVLSLLLGVAGCSHVQPWQRSKLAHPSMTMETSGPAQEHAYSVQEGAVGGGAVAETGCGCN